MVSTRSDNALETEISIAEIVEDVHDESVQDHHTAWIEAHSKYERTVEPDEREFTLQQRAYEVEEINKNLVLPEIARRFNRATSGVIDTARNYGRKIVRTALAAGLSGFLMAEPLAAQVVPDSAQVVPDSVVNISGLKVVADRDAPSAPNGLLEIELSDRSFGDQTLATVITTPNVYSIAPFVNNQAAKDVLFLATPYREVGSFFLPLVIRNDLGNYTANAFSDDLIFQRDTKVTALTPSGDLALVESTREFSDFARLEMELSEYSVAFGLNKDYFRVSGSFQRIDVPESILPEEAKIAAQALGQGNRGHLIAQVGTHSGPRLTLEGYRMGLDVNMQDEKLGLFDHIERSDQNFRIAHLEIPLYDITIEGILSQQNGNADLSFQPKRGVIPELSDRSLDLLTTGLALDYPGGVFGFTHSRVEAGASYTKFKNLDLNQFFSRFFGIPDMEEFLFDISRDYSVDAYFPVFWDLLNQIPFDYNITTEANYISSRNYSVNQIFGEREISLPFDISARVNGKIENADAYSDTQWSFFADLKKRISNEVVVNASFGDFNDYPQAMTSPMALEPLTSAVTAEGTVYGEGESIIRSDIGTVTGSISFQGSYSPLENETLHPDVISQRTRYGELGATYVTGNNSFSSSIGYKNAGWLKFSPDAEISGFTWHSGWQWLTDNASITAGFAVRNMQLQGEDEIDAPGVAKYQGKIIGTFDSGIFTYLGSFGFNSGIVFPNNLVSREGRGTENTGPRMDLDLLTSTSFNDFSLTFGVINVLGWLEYFEWINANHTIAIYGDGKEFDRPFALNAKITYQLRN